MNVKNLCGIIYRPDSGPIKIHLAYDGDRVAEIDINNPFHLEAYGKFKVETVQALNRDTYGVVIAMAPARPIVEE